MDCLGLNGEREWIVAETLRIDPHYQRTPNEEHLARIMEDFNPHGLGVLQVSRRRDGDYVLDGQHRLLSVQRLGLAHLKVHCIVYLGLHLEQEEELFLLFNQGHLPLNAYHAFKTRTRNPDLTTEAVMGHLHQLGLTLVPAGVNLGVRQISALHYLEQLERREQLLPVLTVLAAGWGEQRGAFKRLYLEVIARILPNISPEHQPTLVRVLSETPPMALDREALTRQSSPGLQLGSYLAVLRDMLSEQAIHQAPRRPAR